VLLHPWSQCVGMTEVVRQRRQSDRRSPPSDPTGSQDISAPRRRLPVKTRADSPRRAAPSRRSEQRKAPSRPRILVIEDDTYAREALTLLLDYYGYDVVAASNGTDGLALVTDAGPDLVVTDWRMPGLSGHALCVALRERRDTMPIVVVTSADEVFSSDQPVNARLRKPIDPPLLNRVIIDELRAQRQT
jgi:CheY-like chemotaxis protein